jgi:hypothetical protein
MGNIVHIGDLGMRAEKQMMLTPHFGRKLRDQDSADRDSVKARRMVTPGDRMLKYLIQILFPGSGKGHDRRLPGPPCVAYFRSQTKAINPTRHGG